MFVQQSRMKPEYPLEKKQISLLHLQLSALFKPKERNELWINWFPIAPLSDLCVFWRETAEMSRGNLSEACGQKRVVRRALSHFSAFCFVLLVYPPSVAFSLSSNCMRSQPPPACVLVRIQGYRRENPDNKLANLFANYLLQVLIESS